MALAKHSTPPGAAEEPTRRTILNAFMALPIAAVIHKGLNSGDVEGVTAALLMDANTVIQRHREAWLHYSAAWAPYAAGENDDDVPVEDAFDVYDRAEAALIAYVPASLAEVRMLAAYLLEHATLTDNKEYFAGMTGPLLTSWASAAA